MPPCPLLLAALLGAGPVASDAIAPRLPDGVYRIVTIYEVNAQGRVRRENDEAARPLLITKGRMKLLKSQRHGEEAYDVVVRRPADHVDGRIDISSNNGNLKIPALFRFEEGRLQIVFRGDFTERPKSFGDFNVRILEAVPYQPGRLVQSDPLVPLRHLPAPKETPPGGR
jgi:hypothetical protein